ncbi:hypothetical protein GCM10023331_34240 [Algivirga pacifica]|uniref:Secretin/TonB short N-terminal domain-containing protein n=2 Tax=Algivirga pacifica TaxID=1162670 RepID=A0ABP9DLL0_9BACT
MMGMKGVLLLLLWGIGSAFIVPSEGVQTDLLSTKISIELKDATYPEAMALLEQEGGFNFVYSPDALDQLGKVTIKLQQEPLKKALDKLFNGNPLKYKEMDKDTIVIFKDKE